MSLKAANAFTLSELLIALAILGVIATFTIPKVLQSQQDQSYRAKAKEAAGMLSDAYMAYKRSNTPSLNTTVSQLTPYMNYVSFDTSGKTIDATYFGNSLPCNSATPCLNLHNGGVLMYNINVKFGGTNANNAIFAWFDPNGQADGSTTGPSKSVQFWLYFNSRLATKGTIETGTAYENSVGPQTDNPTNNDPPWFGWD